jgi:C4-dicarboxylate-binding protein DctP
MTLAGDSLTKSLSNRGAQSLASWFDHFEQMTAKRPIVGPADVAGLKFLIDQAQDQESLVSVLDAVVPAVPEKEQSDAVRDGRVDGQFTNWEQLRIDGTALIHEGATQTNHAYRGFALIVLNSWWESLDPALRRSLGELIDRTARQANLDTEQRQSNAKRTIIQSGAAVRALTRQQRQSWVDRVEPLWSTVPDKQFLEFLAEADRAL